MDGVQKAIDEYNAAAPAADLPRRQELFQDWALAVYLDDESNSN